MGGCKMFRWHLFLWASIALPGISLLSDSIFVLGMSCSQRLQVAAHEAPLCLVLSVLASPPRALDAMSISYRLEMHLLLFLPAAVQPLLQLPRLNGLCSLDIRMLFFRHVTLSLSGGGRLSHCKLLLCCRLAALTRV